MASPLWAGDGLVKRYAPLLEQCYASANDRAAKYQCVGVMSNHCTSGEENGQTTTGMSRCTDAEFDVWDKILDNEYQLTMDWVKALDKVEAEVFPEFANRAKSLKLAQQTWRMFRSAECDLKYAMSGSGSLRHLTGVGCYMRMTAERAIKLNGLRERDSGL